MDINMQSYKLCALLALAGVVLVGCAIAKPVNLTSSFNAQEARELTRPGVNIVSGSALIRQNGGGVVTCAGLQVLLIPKTAYAAERMRVIYGNTERGYNSVYRQVAFNPEIPEYQSINRSTLCDAQGHFSFDDVADGSFFVVSQIVWNVGGPQGGAVMQAVTVRGGESKQLVLSP
ncbi:hypothetical protein [Pseudomonas sp. HMWF032]|uniref:hypothetical protein n=1 Tax=Pseudomonas sp. HMWF032 TaxID=2056866 RepID=UPI0011B21022|nr:hypothetical protein [Pseudomonas sp. HMWF032]